MAIFSPTRRRCEKMSSCIGFWSSGSFTGSPMVALSIIRAVVLIFRSCVRAAITEHDLSHDLDSNWCTSLSVMARNMHFFRETSNTVVEGKKDNAEKRRGKQGR